MNCNNIREKLSAYIEGIVSSEEKALIDKHLESCQKCSESLSDLKKTVEYVKNLEEIGPPSWLTQKVMTKVRAEAEPKKGIFQRLFYPLHIKLPIEAVAAILIAITTIYIFKTIQPEVKFETTTEFAKGPSEKETTQIPSREKGKIPVIDESKENVIPPFPPLEKGGKRGFEAEQPVPSKKPEIMDKFAEVPKAPAPATKQEETWPFAGAVTKDESKTEVLSRAPKTKALVERKEESISLTLNVKDLEADSKEIEKAVMKLGGKIIKTESSVGKNVLAVELSSKKLKELFEQLKLIGEVKEKEEALEIWEGDVGIPVIVKITTQPQ